MNRFNGDYVASQACDGGGNSLCAAEVALRGLDRDVAEEKLNLL